MHLHVEGRLDRIVPDEFSVQTRGKSREFP